MSLDERESVFQGAISLVIIQATMISLVITELQDYKITPPDEFQILIPRVIAAFFMHANLQGEIKNGLSTMKYVVNHPYSFRKFDPNIHEKEEDEEDEDDQADRDDGLYIRVFYAFMLGFLQTSMGLVLEVMSIYYLSAQTSFRLILMSYATMAAIAAFDDLYARSLLEHPIRAIIGKKIGIVYRRCMHFEGKSIEEAIMRERDIRFKKGKFHK